MPAYSSLPDRQLRKMEVRKSLKEVCSLPDRQLRKCIGIVNNFRRSSLPDRQLRKSLIDMIAQHYRFTAR